MSWRWWPATGVLVVSLLAACSDGGVPPPTLAAGHQHNDANGEECAYWNQDELDPATHLIEQSRQLQLAVSVHDGSTPLAGMSLEVRAPVSEYLTSTPRVLKLDVAGQGSTPIEYGHSRVSLRIPPPAAALSGWTGAELSWFQPGRWFDRLEVDLDVDAFGVDASPPDSAGRIEYTVTYPKEWTSPQLGGSFGNLLGIGNGSLTSMTIVEPGRARIVVDMRSFFAEWNDNYSKPFAVGDRYPLTLMLSNSIAAPVVVATPSSRQDPPYVPRTYACQRDPSDGNPFADVPSTEPRVELELSLEESILVTSAMIPV